MRTLICCAVVGALVVCAGCAKQETTEPASETAPAAEASVDEQPMASEDFETGEAKGVVDEGEAVTETEPEDGDEGEDN